MPARTPRPRTAPVGLAASLPLLAGGAASAQADFPAVFIANNGNFEGSVTTMRVEPDGALTFVSRVVTGSRSSFSQPCPGCNTTAIDIAPSGRFIATAHAAGDGGENLTVYEVASDGSLTVVEELTLAEGGLDIQWLSDSVIALPLTDLNQVNQIRLYELDEDNELTLTDSINAGTFCTSIALHPSGKWLYANDSFANTVRVFDVNRGVEITLSLTETVSLPLFGVAVEVDPTGMFLYAAGGISAGGNAFAGYRIDRLRGTLTPIPGSPFTSPGASPKGFAFDGPYLYVSHGTDATIRAFTIDPAGVPISTGFSFDIGLQGSLREMATMPGRLFTLDESTAIDGVRGAYSFTVDAGSGDLIPTPSSPVDTQGISPNDLAVWRNPQGCNPGDLAAPFGVLDLSDIQAFIAAFQSSEPLADLAPPTGVYDLADVQAFITAFTSGCP